LKRGSGCTKSIPVSPKCSGAQACKVAAGLAETLLPRIWVDLRPVRKRMQV